MKTDLLHSTWHGYCEDKLTRLTKYGVFSSGFNLRHNLAICLERSDHSAHSNMMSEQPLQTDNHNDDDDDDDDV